MYISYSEMMLKLQNFLQKTFFFLYFRSRPKKGEGTNKRDVGSICASVTKPALKKRGKC